jgi:hypothetical protein
MTIGNVNFGIGALIALLVVVVALILWLTDHTIVKDIDFLYGLVIALGIARIVP